MFSKSQLTRMIDALMLQPVIDVEELTRLRSLPYHDRSKGKGKSKPGKVYKIKPLKTYNKTQECARRINRGWY